MNLSDEQAEQYMRESNNPKLIRLCHLFDTLEEVEEQIVNIESQAVKLGKGTN